MNVKRPRLDVVNGRINQRAIELFQEGRSMLADGVSDTSRGFYEVSLNLHRALGLKPWQLEVFDFELYVMEPEKHPPHVGFDLVRELHQQLVAAM